MKKLISMVVCTLMLQSCTIPVFAAESNIDNDNIHSPAFCTDVISEIADSTVMAVYHQQVMRFIIISDKPYQNIRQKTIIPFTLIQTYTFTTKCVSQSSIFIIGQRENNYLAPPIEPYVRISYTALQLIFQLLLSNRIRD